MSFEPTKIRIVGKNTYYDALGTFQNMPENVGSDIMTITALMTWEQKLIHLNKYAKYSNEKFISFDGED